MKSIKEYTLVKVMFESNDYKNLFCSKYVVMSISEKGRDDYIKITAVKGVGMSAKRKSETIPMDEICVKEIIRSMKSNFKFNLIKFIN